MRVQLAACLAAWLVATAAGAQQVTKETVNGITNFSRLETTVACAGATKAEAVPEVKKMGFASIINLRLPDEKDANIPAEEAAAKEVGINYVHIPFDGGALDPAVVDRFLDAISDPANQPAFIHCASANRAAAMWMAKRLVIDKWEVPRAAAEAESLGLTNAKLKDFVVSYANSHKQQ